MRWFANRYSLLITSALAMGGAWGLAARLGGLLPSVAVAAVGLGLALAQRRLRGGASSVLSWADLEQAVTSTGPVLLFLYSDT